MISRIKPATVHRRKPLNPLVAGRGRTEGEAPRGALAQNWRNQTSAKCPQPATVGFSLFSVASPCEFCSRGGNRAMLLMLLPVAAVAAAPASEKADSIVVI